MNPLAIAAIGAGVLLVPLAAVGAVFVGVWAIEEWDKGRNRKTAQAALARKATR